ncbi:MAG: hypothetical protein ACLU6Y_01425 [Ruminococcus sp.]
MEEYRDLEQEEKAIEEEKSELNRKREPPEMWISFLKKEKV